MAKSPDTKVQRSTAVAPPGQPPRLQVAALCWRRAGQGMRVLLDHQPRHRPLGDPQGLADAPPHRGRGGRARGLEEAGLRGEVPDRSIGVYTYRKVLAPGRTIPCAVRVYPLEVREMLKQYPETGQRRVRWFSRDKAARRVLEPELKALIRAFEPAAV